MLEYFLYGLAALGALTLAAFYQDSKTRGAAKKAGTPVLHPGLLTLFSAALSGLLHEATKPKKPKEVKA
jgi:hypothetical protein